MLNCTKLIKSLVALCALCVACAAESRSNAQGSLPAIPYPDALDASAVNEPNLPNLTANGLLLGNGDLNSLLFERDGALCLRVSKNDVWDARVDTSQDPEMLKVDLVNQKWHGGSGSTPSWGKPYPSPRSAGIVRFEDKIAPEADRTATLDLRRAVARTAGTTVRALADRNVLLIETDRPLVLEEIKAKHLPAAELGDTEGVKWLSMKMPGDEDYAGLEYAMALAGNGRIKAVSLVTSVDIKGGNVREAAIRLAKETAAEEAATLIAKHEAEWAKFWSASGVKLEDPDFTRWWYRMAYYLRCCTAPRALPIGLYVGSWSDSAPWHGDYHHNYNVWQPYWSSFIINHADLSDSFVDYMNQMLPRLKWLAKETYGCEGAYVGISSFIFEPDPAICKSKNKRQLALTPWGYTMGMIGMSTQVLWQRHLYQPDPVYLKTKIYPVLKEAALFFCSFAEKCPRDAEGKVKLGPSYSPEHGPFGVANVPFDLAYARYTLKAAIRAASELQCDQEFVERCQNTIAMLPDYPTALDSQGKPVVVDWLGCKFKEVAMHNIAVPSVPVFPGEQVTWFSQGPTKELFRNTIRQTSHGWLNATVMHSVAMARLSMPEALDHARGYYKSIEKPNGMFVPDCGPLVESVGVAAMISEYLLQSVDDTLRVFPCWPKDKDAAFANLRAQGGFLVSAEQKGGKVTKLEITSTVGGKLQILNPWPGKSVQVIRNGKLAEGLAPDLTVKASGATAEALAKEGNRLILQTAGDEILRLAPLPDPPVKPEKR